MLSYLNEEANRLGMPIDIRIGTADTLSVPDNSVDVVISTLVLCCVPSQRRCLREVLRVLKPGGKFVFIEHVAAPRGTRLRRIQNLVTPLWKRLGDGCHPTAKPGASLNMLGSRKLTAKRLKPTNGGWVCPSAFRSDFGNLKSYL